MVCLPIRPQGVVKVIWFIINIADLTSFCGEIIIIYCFYQLSPPCDPSQPSCSRAAWLPAFQSLMNSMFLGPRANQIQRANGNPVIRKEETGQQHPDEIQNNYTSLEPQMTIGRAKRLRNELDISTPFIDGLNEIKTTSIITIITVASAENRHWLII